VADFCKKFLRFVIHHILIVQAERKLRQSLMLRYTGFILQQTFLHERQHDKLFPSSACKCPYSTSEKNMFTSTCTIKSSAAV
jgi:hypothetical protein